MSSSNPQVADNDIAIVGMAARFPGAADVEQYWSNLRAGVESLTQLSDGEMEAAGVDLRALRDPSYVRSAFLLDGVDYFDHTFFGLSPKEGAVMDPQHRHFLECAWSATEHAGHAPENFSGRIGVYAGCGMNNYLIHNLLTNPALVRSEGMFLLRHTGNDKDFLATRVSYAMNLTGPSLSIQTACSTSLVAIHVACQSLLNGECDMAIAGGSTIRQPHRAGYLYEEGGVVAPDGHCRAFDANAEGTVFGSGAGAVILRRLADALADGDTIHAVIKGSAINNDGSQKVGYLAPSVDRQGEAVAEAIAIADVDPDTITYVEAHGTGTPVGDPIEIAALTQAFRRGTARIGYCAVGSLKANVGHMDTAAGVAGVIKVTQALRHRELPPSINYSAPNPGIDFQSSPFFVNDRLRSWDSNGTPRRAGVNALGVGGTNAHVILEEAPPQEDSDPATGASLLVLSAKTKAALDRGVQNLAAHLRNAPDTNLADVAYTLQVGRTAFTHRRAISASTLAEAVELLETAEPKRVVAGESSSETPRPAMMFSGGGAQYAGMGAELYCDEPVYRAAVDRCCEILAPLLNWDVRALLYPQDRAAANLELERPSRALPALFVTQYALAKQLMSWGILPDALIGHSMGEYTAAHLAGVFSLEDALALVTLRGQLFERVPEGGMLSVGMSADELQPLLGAELSIAAINAPELCVASGPTGALDALQAMLEERDVHCQRIHISIAAHSSMLEPILKDFGEFFRRVKLNAPQLPLASNVTGTWITAADATDPAYWVRHLRNTVRFADGVSELLAEPHRVLIEVGPGRVLSTLSRLHPQFGAGHVAVQTMPHPDEERPGPAYLLESLGRMWVHGLPLSWKLLQGEARRRRIPLPTYSFERQRCWIDPGKQIGLPLDDEAPIKRADITEWFYQPSWKRSVPVPSASPGTGALVVLLREEQSLADALAARLRDGGARVVEVFPGEAFESLGADRYVASPGSGTDFDALLDAIATETQQLPTHIVHLWNVTEPTTVSHLDQLEMLEVRAFYSLLILAQAIGRADYTHIMKLHIVSNEMQHVAGETSLSPVKALAIGPCRVIAHEFSNIATRSVDIVVPAAGSIAERRLVARISGELAADTSEQVVALRGSDRWVQSFEPAPLPQQPAPLRDGGTYVITGGLGGIALELAESLARTRRSNIVLLARSALPMRSEWSTYIAANGEDDRMSRRLRSIERMEAAGSEIMVVSVDITDRAQLSVALDNARLRFGAINGVLHTAGVLDDGLILAKEFGSAVSVLAPKVRGTLLLDELLRQDELDFFILFSSRSSLTGITGQIDYAAANAFLDAFAHAKVLEGAPVTAVNWSAWQEVGMVAEMAGAAAGPKEETVDHPMIDHRVRLAPKQDAFVTEFTLGRHWVLDDHRIRDGVALLPGTGYLELVRAAFEQPAQDLPLQMEEVFFIAPFSVEPGEAKELRVTLDRTGDGTEFVVQGGRPDTGYVDHATGRIAYQLARGIPKQFDLADLEARCSVHEETFHGRRREHLELGPRWDNLRHIRYGAAEALATIELPAAYAGETALYRLHPALLDVATACAQQLIPGFDAHEHFYVPASYTRLIAYGAVPESFHSYIRYRPSQGDAGDVAVFDISIIDATGVEVVAISEFVMMRVHDRTSVGRGAAGVTAVRAEPSRTDTLAVDLRDAISSAEGVEAFTRILATSDVAQLVVSPQDLPRYLAHLARRTENAGQSEQRPAQLANVPEAEAALAQHPAVAANVVLVREDQQTARLVAYVVYRSDESATVSELRRFMRDRLPEGKVPQNFVELDELPRTVAGAVDIYVLPDPFAADDDFVAPRTETERAIARIWQELLGVSRVGLHDNFLDIGGHSLLALRAINRIAKTCGVRLSPSALNLQTLEQIAAQCGSGEAARTPQREATGSEVQTGPEESGTEPRPTSGRLMNAIKQSIGRA